jgi:hypothetical protein
MPSAAQRKQTSDRTPSDASDWSLAPRLTAVSQDPVVFRNPGRHLAYAAAAPFETVTELQVDFEDRDGLGVQMVWLSSQRGVVATFPWWGPTELARVFEAPEWPPIGTEQESLLDADQDWFFRSWRQDDFVYWVEGFDGASWERRLRVPVAVFNRAWGDARLQFARGERPA